MLCPAFFMPLDDGLQLRNETFHDSFGFLQQPMEDFYVNEDFYVMS